MGGDSPSLYYHPPGDFKSRTHNKRHTDFCDVLSVSVGSQESLDAHLFVENIPIVC